MGFSRKSKLPFQCGEIGEAMLWRAGHSKIPLKQYIPCKQRGKNGQTMNLFFFALAIFEVRGDVDVLLVVFCLFFF